MRVINFRIIISIIIIIIIIIDMDPIPVQQAKCSSSVKRDIMRPALVLWCSIWKLADIS